MLFRGRATRRRTRSSARTRSRASRRTCGGAGRGRPDSRASPPRSASTTARPSTSRSTSGATYTIDIYRLGWYGGDGARLIATASAQRAAAADAAAVPHRRHTGLVDCGNWAVSASLARPGRRGLRHLHRAARRATTPAAQSHIVFVVRNDASHSTCRADVRHHVAGLQPLRRQQPLPGRRRRAGRAYKVSYNRPFITRANDPEDWFDFNAEYPMVRFLEPTATTSATSPASTPTAAARCC